MQFKFLPQSSADQRFFRRFAIIYTQHALSQMLVFSDPRRNTERCFRNRKYTFIILLQKRANRRNGNRISIHHLS